MNRRRRKAPRLIMETGKGEETAYISEENMVEPPPIITGCVERV
jgi:hypothetical protein